ncbi:MAG TPA: 30S ribosomal protein S19 [Spirochaetota bacterium]|nr:30S ribosomal protein S19 [Spirochaetota bacterium]
MARSLKKGPYISVKLYKKIKKADESGSTQPIKTFSRASTIIPEMIAKTFMVYNGHKFIPVRVHENLVGHKLGEFAPTRLFKSHAGDRQMK